VICPETWPFNLNELPKDAYLVGGAVRDALLDRRSAHIDLDFVLPTPTISFARQFAQQHHAGFVVLDQAREIARVVFPQATVDFAMQEGDSLDTDLRRRDFTVNAIAYQPHTQRFIDPLNGRDDLARGQLRMVSRQNLADDPLRLLRAYRQAAQLSFDIDIETRHAVRQLAALLQRVAAERIGSEIQYLLSSPNGTPWLMAAIDDGLLQDCFPSATPKQARVIARFDRSLPHFAQRYPSLSFALHNPIPQSARCTVLMLAKLASLITDVPFEVEPQLRQLKYSNAERRAVLALKRAIAQTPTSEAVQAFSVRDRFFWFQEVGELFPAWCLWAVAMGFADAAIAPLVEAYNDPDNLVAHPRPLIDGKTLVEAIALPRSPIVGELLTEIAIAYAEGVVSSTAEAIAWAQAWYERSQS